MKNYYDILGVQESSTQDEIKKAYRKLSKQYHPDVNPQGEEMFKEISEAYDNIGDENKRADYDNRRKNPFQGFDVGSGGFDINSIFEQMMNGGGRPTNQRIVVPDKIIEVTLNPVESYFGIKKDIEFVANIQCNPCQGEGGERKICTTCNGSGHIIKVFGTGLFRQQVQTACNICNGSGSMLTQKCPICVGSGVNQTKEKLNINIPKNVDNGDFMRVRKKGDYYNQIKDRGDLILKVNMDNSQEFEKINIDLVYKKKLQVSELLLSNTLEIEHPEGKLKISLPDNLDTDKPLRIPNKGFYDNTVRGNFYIKLSVIKNKNLSENEINKINEILK
jgi:molecular chaperone DnaJ